MNSPHETIYRIHAACLARGIDAAMSDVAALRRCAMTLHRWAELECGDSNDYASWSIERDETTGKPYMCRYPHNDNQSYRTPIADRETGALKRVAAICRRIGCHFYHQTDPRGASLYIAAEPLTDSNYSHGIAVYR